MTPSQIIALVRDAVILGVLGYILWFIHHADMNAAKVADLQGVEKQLQANAAQQAKWENERESAEAQRMVDNAAIVAAVGAHTEPVRLCNSSSTRPMPSASGSSPGHTAVPGGHDEGPGSDIRPQISAFELKYEGYLASCRSILNSWPK